MSFRPYIILIVIFSLYGLHEDLKIESQELDTIFTEMGSSTFNGTNANVESNFSIITILNSSYAENIGAQQEDIYFLLKQSQPLSIIYKGYSYELILFDSGVGSICGDFQSVDSLSFFGWTTSSVKDSVTIYSTVNFLSITIWDSILNKEIRIEEASSELLDFFQLSGESGDLLIYDTNDLLGANYTDGTRIVPNTIDLIPEDNSRSTSISPQIYSKSSHLFRLGIYIDEGISTNELSKACVAINQVHELYLTQLNVWIEIEFIDEIPSTNSLLVGYQDWFNDDFCNDTTFDKFMAYLQNDELGNGPSSSRIRSDDNEWTTWTRGKFLDSALFLVDDPFWNPSCGGKASAGPRHQYTGIDKRINALIIDYGDIGKGSHILYPFVPHSTDFKLTIAHEIGHNFDLAHSDGICQGNWAIKSYTIMQHSYCYGLIKTIWNFAFSYDSHIILNDQSNLFGVWNMGILRSYSIPSQSTPISLHGLQLKSFSVDLVKHPMGMVACGFFYRAEFSLEYVGFGSLAISEFFNSVRSTTNPRMLDGEWDYWLSYHRSQSPNSPVLVMQNGDEYTFRLKASDGNPVNIGERFFGSGFIKDDRQINCTSAGPITLPGLPPQNANDAYMNHHPDQTGWAHIWVIHPVVNVGSDWSTFASYIQFSEVAIEIYVG